MRHAPTAWLAAAMALAAGPMPSSAETAPPAPPRAVPTPDAPADPAAERQRNSAAKLAGMINFVSYFCPEAKPDYDRFKQVIARMGVDLKELEQGGSLVVRSAAYTEAYRKDTAESCKRAFEHFGEAGTTIPGLIARKDLSKEPEAKEAAPKEPANEPAPKNP